MLLLRIDDSFGDFAMTATRFKVQQEKWFWLLENTILGETFLFSALCSGIFCTQLRHKQMNHIYVRDLIDLSKWGRFLFGEKFGFFCEWCAHGKQHESVTFGRKDDQEASFNFGLVEFKLMWRFVELVLWFHTVYDTKIKRETFSFGSYLL